MARRQLRKAWHFEEPTINLTALIDVVFVILIMFIIIAPLLELDRIELATSGGDPLDQAIVVQESSPISLHVFPDNSIQFNQKRVEPADLVELLKEAKEKYPSVKPQVFHDRRAHFGTYQTLKNAAEMAGFEQIDIVLKP